MKEKVIRTKFRVKTVFILAITLLLSQTLTLIGMSEFNWADFIPTLVICGGSAFFLYTGTRMEKITLTDNEMTVRSGAMLHVKIEKTKVRSFKIRDTTKLERFFGQPKQIIEVKYNTFDDGVIQSTDPAVIQWLEEAKAS